MREIIIDNNVVTPIGIHKVIKGIRYEVTNPITGEKTWEGNGEILYDISDKRSRPYGYILLKKGEQKNYLTFTSNEDGSKVSYIIRGEIEKDIFISTDGKTWLSWDGSELTLNNGDSIKVKNNLDTLSISSSDYLRFKITGSVSASGDCMSLLNFKDIYDSCFCSLFRSCTGLINAPIISSTNIAPSCYSNMFNGCSNLLNGPDLLSTEVDDYCYSFMFSGCSKLISLKIFYEGNFNTSFNQWLSEVNTTGVLYYNGTDRKSGSSGIPTNWITQSF